MKANIVRPILAGFLILASASCVLPLGLAQSPDAPPLSKDVKILYAHHHDSDTAELSGWMNTLADDPTANDIALGPGGELAGTRVYTIQMDPPPTSDVALDGAGKVKITAYIGAGSGNGIVRVNTTLKSGAQVVADGAVKDHVFQAAGTAQYPTVTWEVTPAVTTLTGGQPLVWYITLQGAAQAVFLGVHPDRGRSNIELPATSTAGPVVGQTIYHNLSGDEVDITHAFTNVTTATHIYNWTTHHPQVEISYEADVANGSVAFAVVDAEDATLARENLSADASDSITADGAGGKWRITVEFRAFKGEFSLTIVNSTGSTATTTPTSPTPRTTGTGTPTDTGETTNTTAASPTDTGKKGGIPFVGGWTMLATLLGAAAVLTLRRRP